MEPQHEKMTIEIETRDLSFVISQLKQSEANYEVMSQNLMLHQRVDESIRMNGLSIKCGRIARYISDKMGKREGQ